MGAHVWGPAYLRDHILPHWRLTGWSPDWYAGFPMYLFYMVPPALVVVLLDVLLPYGVALKIVSVARHPDACPSAAWAFGKLAGLRFPIPPLFADRRRSSSCSTRPSTIYGGNIASTMAGEFSFSIALSLSMLFLGVFAYGLRTGKHRALAAVLFALAVPVPRDRHLLRRRRRRRAVRSCGRTEAATVRSPAIGVVGGLLSAVLGHPVPVAAPRT